MYEDLTDREKALLSQFTGEPEIWFKNRVITFGIESARAMLKEKIGE
ncbi:MAG: hypothetical protein U9O94_06015 [Nanoarchaeota archaeon]|nr:hypothetical protein [Nanoarchaeota archaeon]